MPKIIHYILIGLIGWDMLTTYYGTLSIFYDGYERDVVGRVTDAEAFKHIVSLIFAVALIVFILMHQRIWEAKNKITMPILVIAFLYDFATSFYGTGEAVGMKYNDIPQLFIVFLLAIMTTAAPILMAHLWEE